jgi:hypothetical protein
MLARLAEWAQRQGRTAGPEERCAQAERTAELLLRVYSVRALERAEIIERRSHVPVFARAVRNAVARRLTDFNRL